MKTKKTIYLAILLLCFSSFVTSFSADTTIHNKHAKTSRVTFKLRGTGSKGISVKIGVGEKIGYGACCTAVSPNTTVSFTGNDGHVVYDSERKRVLTKIYPGLEGTVIELKDYY